MRQVNTFRVSASNNTIYVSLIELFCEAGLFWLLRGVDCRGRERALKHQCGKTGEIRAIVHNAEASTWVDMAVP
jgi:hypothetical protein